MTLHRNPRAWLAGAVVLFFVLGGLQIWSALATRDMVMKAMNEPIGSAAADFEREKARQEAIRTRIENSSKALLQTNLAAAIGAGLGVAISASGALIALFGYLDSRRKDREDRREAQEKDRQDRLGTVLSETLSRLVASESRERAVGAAGLLPFFTPDRSDFHLQAMAALIASARSEKEPAEVRQSIRLAVETAARSVEAATLRKVSWQGANLQRADLRGCDLAGVDLRDAELHNANLTGASLVGADLTNAKLQGARLDGADLSQANLTYADLAGASLGEARLAGAVLEGLKVLNLDVADADLRDAGPGWRGVPWEGTRNWRRARFDEAVKSELEARYGPEAPDLNVLMLLWEAPPLVAGGSWTACYHLVRKLRRRGAAVTVVAPWARESIDATPFGVDVDVPMVSLGIAPPAEGGSPYGVSSAYDRAYGPGPYGGGGGGPYDRLSAYGSYGAAADAAGSTLYRLVAEFRRRMEAHVADRRPDVIHAHDWVAFDAARAASARTGAPWVAHFHSIETDRRPDRPDELIVRIEQMAVDTAARLVVPSNATRIRLIAAYGARAAKADVVPNVLSEGAAATAEMGRFESRRVIFLGRLTPQKGVDRFGAVAELVRRSDPSIAFHVWGDGEERSLLSRYGLQWRGRLDWERRGQAFAGASALLAPSRSEPFGMVVLEAMQHRVPVLYPAASGAAEVLQSGVKIDPAQTASVAAEVIQLLGSLTTWETTLRAQAEEIDAYRDRPYEDQLFAVWRQASQGAAEASGG